MMHKAGGLADHEKLLKIFQSIDLTSLGDNDSANDMFDLLDVVTYREASVAALCVYPQFIELLSEEVSPEKIKLVTVANFPAGDESKEEIQFALNEILELPVQEVDFVLPYRRLFEGKSEEVISILQYVVQTCHERDVLVKVILESGIFENKEILYTTAMMVLECGADFLKTSTGKVNIGARLEDVSVFCEAIKDYGDLTRGIKVSGGIRSVEDALKFYDLVAREMGEDWITASQFRIGTSQLAGNLIESLDKTCI